MKLVCRLGFHLPIYWSKGDVLFHFYKTMTYDQIKCAWCDQELQKPKKQVRLEAEIEKETQRIRQEIKEFGHPKIHGVIL